MSGLSGCLDLAQVDDLAVSVGDVFAAGGCRMLNIGPVSLILTRAQLAVLRRTLDDDTAPTRGRMREVLAVLNVCGEEMVDPEADWHTVRRHCVLEPHPTGAHWAAGRAWHTRTPGQLCAASWAADDPRLVSVGGHES